MHILCIGCGNMASAMIGKWVQHAVTITTVSPSGKTPFGDKIASYTAVSALPHTDFDFVFYMAKPQMVTDILPQYTRLNHNTWATIAAGVPIATYKAILGEHTPIIRIMPNTPAHIGEGVCPAYTNDTLTDTVKTRIESLLSPLGTWGWLPSEDDLHTVTALSGSGVAYIYYLIECMAQIATTMGLPAQHATTWAIQTVSGAGKMAQHSTDDVATLRQKVTSPNGVTAQALQVLMQDNRLHQLLNDTMQQAVIRSKQLSKHSL